MKQSGKTQSAGRHAGVTSGQDDGCMDCRRFMLLRCGVTPGEDLIQKRGPFSTENVDEEYS